MHNINALIDIVNCEVANLRFDTPPPTLFAPVNYILSLGGKRIRPVLTLIGCELMGGDYRKAMPTAMAMEVFHNFTLLHDDLMDKADMRRGKPTVHKKWDDNTAVLSGDAMLIEAYHLMAKNAPQHLPALLRLFNQTATEVCCGQQMDMEFEARTDVTEEEYIEMIRLKTAVLLGCSLQLGAMVADAEPADAELLYNFGINSGLGFQLKDDLLDVYGNESTFGKAIGGDICNNKKTFLLINALQNEKARPELLTWIARTDFERAEKVSAVTEIYNRLGLRQLVEQRIQHYHNEALQLLGQVSAREEDKEVLRQLASGLNQRQL